MLSQSFRLSAGRRIFSLAGLAFLTLLTARCTTDDKADPPVVDTTIQILSPTAPASFKLSENFTMVVKCDYSKFASGLNFQLSSDSSKTWRLMKSLPRKEGVALDTLNWDPIADSPGDVEPGKPVLIRVIDYNKQHFTISKYFTFTN
jgi:hypothetical protein